MELHDVWFVLIAVLWIGYFFLEGFDFGVGVLTKLLARDRTERRVLINTIGPVWDGNEVWLLTMRRCDLRSLPRVVCHPLLRLLSAAAAHPGLPDRARSRLRVPAQAGRGALADQLGACDLLDLAAACPAVGRRLRQHRARREDRRTEGVRRHLRRSAQPVRDSGRARHADPVHLPRCGVRRAEDGGRHPGTGARPGPEAGAAHRRPGARLPDLDAGLARRRQESGRDDGRSGGARRRDCGHQGGARRLVVRAVRCHDRGRRRDAVPDALSERHAVHAQ